MWNQYTIDYGFLTAKHHQPKCNQRFVHPDDSPGQYFMERKMCLIFCAFICMLEGIIATSTVHFITKTAFLTAIFNYEWRRHYCHVLYCGLHASSTKSLQLVLNAAARILTGRSKFDHIIPVLPSLHWILIKIRIYGNFSFEDKKSEMKKWRKCSVSHKFIYYYSFLKNYVRHE